VSSRIRNHIRGNVVGYVALFLVLTGGTAQALNGSNTVFSDDIVNREVKSGDLGIQSVRGTHLAPNSIRTGKVVDNNLTGADVSNLTGADVTDGTLDGNDITGNSLNSDQINESQVGIGGDLGFSLANAQLRPDVVDSQAVAPNSLTDVDIDESQLGTVPLAANAQHVDGKSVEVFSMHEPNPPNLGDMVTVGGLSMRIDCHGITPGNDNVEIEARTDSNLSWLQAVVKPDGSQNPVTTQSDLSFNPGDVKEVQAAGDGAGYLIYRRGTSDEIVTVSFAYNEGSSSCDAMGVMTGSG
jgi:hypothetical protein